MQPQQQDQQPHKEQEACCEGMCLLARLCHCSCWVMQPQQHLTRSHAKTGKFLVAACASWPVSVNAHAGSCNRSNTQPAAMQEEDREACC